MAIRHEHSAVGRALRRADRRGPRLRRGRARPLRLAAILHDVGKIAVPEAVLRKPEPLTDAERALVERHPDAGRRHGRADRRPRAELAPWVRHSHEHVDGSGYPAGLAGDEIPLEARILLSPTRSTR